MSHSNISSISNISNISNILETVGTLVPAQLLSSVEPFICEELIIVELGHIGHTHITLPFVYFQLCQYLLIIVIAIAVASASWLNSDELIPRIVNDGWGNLLEDGKKLPLCVIDDNWNETCCW